MNLTAQLEFKFVYFKAAAQYFSHYITKTPDFHSSVIFLKKYYSVSHIKMFKIS